MIRKVAQPFGGELSSSSIAKRSPIRAQIGSHQPGPDRSLMISRVTLPRITFVAAGVFGIGWRKAAQSAGREQVALNYAQNVLRPGFREHGIRKTDTKVLVRLVRSIRFGSVNYFVQTPCRSIPESLIELPAPP